jgi:hypothetical protein
MFPPTIKVAYLDQEFVTYLQRHPGLISLSVYNDHSNNATYNAQQSDWLNTILMKHSQTLQYLKVTSRTLLSLVSKNLQNELNFLPCIHLRELVVVMKRTMIYEGCDRWCESAAFSYHVRFFSKRARNGTTAYSLEYTGRRDISNNRPLSLLISGVDRV